MRVLEQYTRGNLSFLTRRRGWSTKESKFSVAAKCCYFTLNLSLRCHHAVRHQLIFVTFSLVSR
jgi:hypothetical protein